MSHLAIHLNRIRFFIVSKNNFWCDSIMNQVQVHHFHFLIWPTCQNKFCFWNSWWKKLSQLPPIVFLLFPLCVCVRACVHLLQLLRDPLRSQTLCGFDWRCSRALGLVSHPPPPLFSFIPFSISSTSFVSLCFTLCLHITLWVVHN